MRDSHAHGKKGDVVHWLDGRDTRSVGNGRYGSEHQRPHVQPVQPGRDGREANWGRRVRWRPRRAKGIAFITVDGMGGRASLWITYTILNTWVMVRFKTVRQGSLWRERPPQKGRQRADTFADTFVRPRGAPAAKKGGALSPPAPLSHGTPLRRAGGGHARRSLASLFRKGRGKSVLSRVRCGVLGMSPTTTARAPPSEREALCVAGSPTC